MLPIDTYLLRGSLRYPLLTESILEVTLGSLLDMVINVIPLIYICKAITLSYQIPQLEFISADCRHEAIKEAPRCQLISLGFKKRTKG